MCTYTYIYVYISGRGSGLPCSKLRWHNWKASADSMKEKLAPKIKLLKYSFFCKPPLLKHARILS